MTSTSEKVKERIAKLLNLADCDAASENEIEQAMAHARKMLEDHQLSEADVRGEMADDAKPAAPAMGQTQSPSGTSKLATWEGTLAALIARHIVGTVGCYLPHGTMDAPGDLFGAKQVKSVMFYGNAEDCAIAASLYQQLRHTIATMALARWGGVYRGKGRSYAEGFIAGLRQQTAAQAVEGKQANHDRSTALATIRGDAITQAKNWLKYSQGISLGRSTAKAGGNHYSDAHGQGRNDGRSTSTAFTRTAKIGGSGTKRLGA
tara:strand:+ start:60881 stop:61666 length:786 start_codon:yes stop_codon:yes gene_type:complete